MSTTNSNSWYEIPLDSSRRGQFPYSLNILNKPKAEQQSERSSLDKPISSCEYIVGYLYLYIKISTADTHQSPAAPVSLAQKAESI